VCVWLIGRSFTQLIGDLNELRCKDYGDEARGAHRSVLYRRTHYTMLRTRAAASTLPRVLEYSSTTRVLNYSSNFLLLEYSLISISGCKFPFPVQF